ncbi:MAG TPA: GspH/FimT family pseudopilin [Thermoanaerobaculia bacterium]|nr:GspH/FimT family pseudopilin [Thermoanaerobaculia bacterium]
MKKRTTRWQRGYNMTEMVVVLAMVSLFSLVTVPPMLSYMSQIRVRSATRQLNSDIRFARQRAITRNNPVAFSFTLGDVEPDPGMEKARYVMYDRGAIVSTSPLRYNWTQVGTIRYLEGVYFLPSNFAVDAAVVDADPDIIFRPNGTIENLPATPLVAVRTERDIPNNRVTDRFSAAGNFVTTLSTD